MLVAQYYYYYKPPKGPPSVLGHIRSATTPGAIRRMSIDRGASRYRTLSAVASNVAAAAALAAQQDGTDERRSSTRYSKRIDRQHAVDENTRGASHVRDGDEEECEDNIIPSSMIESFRSERAGDQPSKRVSWSIERSRGRAASVGRPITSPIPTSLQLLSEESIPFPRSAGATHPDTDLNEPIVSSRGTRASRKGSTMVFLGIWALFSIGTLASQRGVSPSASTANVGRVLSSIKVTSIVPIALDNSRSPRDISHKDSFAFNLELASSKSSIEYTNAEEDPHEDPTSEQVLGRIFAWLCTTLYLTSRLPQIWKNVSFLAYTGEFPLMIHLVCQKISRGRSSRSPADSYVLQ
jgi:hypothetical protein